LALRWIGLVLFLIIAYRTFYGSQKRIPEWRKKPEETKWKSMETFCLFLRLKKKAQTG
jgi:uncharacterized membrane protein YfcA